jgi:hypothetical protein
MAYNLLMYNQVRETKNLGELEMNTKTEKIREEEVGWTLSNGLIVSVKIALIEQLVDTFELGKYEHKDIYIRIESTVDEKSNGSNLRVVDYSGAKWGIGKVAIKDCYSAEILKIKKEMENHPMMLAKKLAENKGLDEAYEYHQEQKTIARFDHGTF